jgi:hypothetical protein
MFFQFSFCPVGEDEGWWVKKGADARSLLAQPEGRNEALVPPAVAGTEVAQKIPSLPHEFHKTTSRAVVFLVHLQMLGHVLDVLRKKRHLNLGGAGVFGRAPEFFNNFPLFHSVSLFFSFFFLRLSAYPP